MTSYSTKVEKEIKARAAGHDKTRSKVSAGLPASKMAALGKVENAKWREQKQKEE